MKEITIQENLSDYLENNLVDIITFQENDHNLEVGLAFNNYSLKEYNILTLCAVVGFLDRFNITAKVNYPNIIEADNKVVGSITNINNNLYLIIDTSIIKASLLQIRIGIKTFINIYYNLLQTKQFNKVIDYLNDILVKGKVNYQLIYNETI